MAFHIGKMIARGWVLTLRLKQQQEELDKLCVGRIDLLSPEAFSVLPVRLPTVEFQSRKKKMTLD